MIDLTKYKKKNELSFAQKAGEFGIGVLRSGEQIPRITGNILGYAGEKTGAAFNLFSPGLGSSVQSFGKSAERLGEEITSAGERSDPTYREETKGIRRMGGELAITAPLPGIGAAKAFQAGNIFKGGAIAGSQFGAVQPIIEKGSEATALEIGAGGVLGGLAGGVISKGVQLTGKGLQKAGDTYARYKAPEKFASNIDKETTSLIRQAVRPSISGIDTTKKFEIQDKKLLQGVKQVVAQGEVPKDYKSAMEAVSKTKEKIWSEVAENNRNVTKLTNGNEISDDISKFIDDPDNTALFRANPKLKQELSYLSDTYKKDPIWQNVSQEGLQDTLTNINQRIPQSSFLKQLDANPTETQKNAILAGILRDKIENNLIEQIGKGNQELRNAYGAVRELEKNLSKRYGVYVRQNPVSLTDLFAMDSIPDILFGIATGTPANVLKGVAKQVIRKGFKNANDPNTIIREIFEKQGKIKGIKFNEPIQPVKIKITGKSQPKVNLGIKEEVKQLPAPKIVTPQTQNRGIIQQSKKELQRAKIGTTDTRNIMEERAKKTIEEVKKKQEVKNKIIKDPQIVQELKNSIQEGKLILRSGTFNGKKIDKEELQAVQRQVNKEEEKIGYSPSVSIKELKPTTSLKGNGGEIIDNKEADRIQIIFDGKPSDEIITKLKSKAFKWSPKNKAWQRMRTENSMKAAKDILGF